MNRQLWISRSLVVLAALLLTVAAAVTSIRTSTPATPTAFGCFSPPIGGYVGAFATCEECESIGADGASQGVWTTWHCRLMNDGYYHLYAT
ncbi:MAG TPA: hypothetical protein VFC19_19445 [Candidatus Limnocylindrales bacterium]|nr:hypothetical protein [Candidatus Limnocylindrales bacterium]